MYVQCIKLFTRGHKRAHTPPNNSANHPYHRSNHHHTSFLHPSLYNYKYDGEFDHASDIKGKGKGKARHHVEPDFGHHVHTGLELERQMMHTGRRSQRDREIEDETDQAILRLFAARESLARMREQEWECEHCEMPAHGQVETEYDYDYASAAGTSILYTEKEYMETEEEASETEA
jgi:hypothetical protein